MRILVHLRQNKSGGYPASDYTISVEHTKWSGVVIKVEYDDVDDQGGGEVVLVPEVARWLGQALLASADTEPGNGSKLLKTHSERRAT